MTTQQTIDRLRSQVASAAATATTASPVDALDLSEEHLDDFFVVYVTGDRVRDPREHDAWRKDLRAALSGMKPQRRHDGTVFVTSADIKRFQEEVHRNDRLITAADYRRRVEAFVRALPHIARQ